VHLPLGLLASIKRHIYGHGLSYGEKGHGGGKYSFAIVALLTTYVFVPSHFRRAAQCNIKLLNWTPVAAVWVQIWLDHIIVVGVLVHGAMHMYYMSHGVGILGGEFVVNDTYDYSTSSHPMLDVWKTQNFGKSATILTLLVRVI
jgi:hypothetical protein